MINRVAEAPRAESKSVSALTCLSVVPGITVNPVDLESFRSLVKRERKCMSFVAFSN